MSNIIRYVESEFRDFKERPFTEVDSLVLAQFVYIDFNRVVPGFSYKSKSVKIADILKAEYFDSMFHLIRDPESNKKLLYALAASPRFRNIAMHFYINEIDEEQEKQFSAITFFINSQLAYVAFRGTDANLVGWKEDLNMAFAAPVPAQLQAKEYIKRLDRFLPKQIILGGHSKGGNLAVYAAMTASHKQQSRIIQVFDHDGPGFDLKFLKTTGYLSIREKIKKTVPEAALIGMIMENDINYSIVKSDRIGIMQHDPFSWQIDDGKFIFTDKIFGISEQLNHSLSLWLGSITYEQRELFVNTLYSILVTEDIKTVSELAVSWSKNIPLVLDKIKELDPEVRRMVVRIIKNLAVISVTKHIP